MCICHPRVTHTIEQTLLFQSLKKAQIVGCQGSIWLYVLRGITPLLLSFNVITPSESCKITPSESCKIQMQMDLLMQVSQTQCAAKEFRDATRYPNPKRIQSNERIQHQNATNHERQ